jgi:hypothetical protein
LYEILHEGMRFLAMAVGLDDPAVISRRFSSAARAVR